MNCYNSELPIGPPGPTGPQGPQGEQGPAGEPLYKVYTALLSQTGTNAPVATVLENTLGVVPVWSRDIAGEYLITATGLFVNAKTWVSAINGGDQIGLNFYIFEFESVDFIRLVQYDYNTGFPTDDIRRGFIEIRVYN